MRPRRGGETVPMSDAKQQLDEIASRAVRLYSRPTVAMELVRLVDEPGVDAKRLRDCIAQDPALTCKILRVVNSSLYGLQRPVADLNQAIGLLGIKPLKLLVLGFNLPDALFAEVAARELRWYWTNTLTRAVAARMIAEQFWNQPGDEAFVAGLLQDIGILVLLRELDEPYARFLTGVIEEKCHLGSLELDTLGFDHIQLSAAVLERWQLPRRLVEAIAMPKWMAKLARLNSPEGDLPQILHLADLLMQLLGQRRLQVLGELLEAGKIYRGVTKSQLAKLVEGLQPQVDQLAQVLSLELLDKRDYRQTLVEAHCQMSALSEEMASESLAPSADDRAHQQLLAHASELSFAMQSFLRGDRSHRTDAEPSRGNAADTIDGRLRLRDFSGDDWCDLSDANELVRELAAAAAQCRKLRVELSVVIVEPNLGNDCSESLAELVKRRAGRALWNACTLLDRENVTLVAISEYRTAAVLVNCERRTAIAVAQHAIDAIGGVDSRQRIGDDGVVTLSAGVATASVVPKNFDPMRMIERAQRCLSAARMSGIGAVKSIEV